MRNHISTPHLRGCSLFRIPVYRIFPQTLFMPAEKITTAEFLEKSGVDKIIEDLKRDLNNKPLIVSDVTDPAGNQYVDLVQEGGGVSGMFLY